MPVPLIRAAFQTYQYWTNTTLVKVLPAHRALLRARGWELQGTVLVWSVRLVRGCLSRSQKGKCNASERGVEQYRYNTRTMWMEATRARECE